MNINAGFLNNLKIQAVDEVGSIDPLSYENRLLAAYLEAMLWSSMDIDAYDEDGNVTEDSNEFLDAEYGFDDISDELMASSKADCDAFHSKAIDIFSANIGEDEEPDYDLEQIGHDFWLDRAGHGAGAEDRDYPGEIGKQLSDAAQSFGHIEVYPGDDKKIYAGQTVQNNVTFVAKPIRTGLPKGMLAKRKAILAAYEQPTIKEQSAGRLVIQVSQEWRDDIEQDGVGLDLEDVMESIIGNSELDWIQPEEIGALTDAPIIGVVLRDDQGELVEAPMVW